MVRRGKPFTGPPELCVFFESLASSGYANREGFFMEEGGEVV